jgi:uncharacterized membrane protein HdeD (DUF308 family)
MVPAGGTVAVSAAGAPERVAGVARSWWMTALRGVAAIVLAVVAFVWPSITLALLVGIFGVYVLLDGGLEAATAVRARREGQSWWLPAAGAVAGIGIGLATFVVTFVVSDPTGRLLVALIGIWAIITGALRLYASFQLREFIGVEWLMVLAGVVMIGLGLLLIFNPDRGLLATLFVLAAGAFVFGVVLLTRAFRLYRLGKRLASVRPGGQAFS